MCHYLHDTGIIELTTGQGSAPGNLLLAQLVDKHVDSKGERSYLCIACGALKKGNAAFDRVLGHATKCKVLEKTARELWIKARQASGQSSIGAQLERIEDAANKNLESGTSKKMVQIGKLDIDQLQVVGKHKEKKNWEEFQS
jgi:hypothetical protein